MSQIKETKTDNKNILVSIFKSCLNILRDCEGLTGEKALRNMSYFVILKLIEPHIGNEIDFDDYEYDFTNIVDEMVEETKIKLLSIVRFSKLSEESEDNIANNIVYLWDNILSNHPATKKIFLKGKGFEFQYKSTYKKIIYKLNSHELSNTDYDVLGLAYEEVIQDVMKGKVLGQFFTQQLVKKMMDMSENVRNIMISAAITDLERNNKEITGRSVTNRVNKLASELVKEFMTQKR